MLFNSYSFVIGFLPLVLVGFAVARQIGPRVALGWLGAASLAFYGWSAPPLVPVLLASMIGNYVAAGLILRTEARPRRQTALLALAIAINLAGLLGGKLFAAVLPLGISFFTFTQIGYLLDCRAGNAPRGSPLGYLLLVGGFAHVIAGPILTAREILPQLEDSTALRLTTRSLAHGSGIFVIGLLKKTLLADPLSPVVAAGFANPQDLGLLPAWQAALAWSLQLYFDFSGYSDMAIGLARMFGLHYPLNFASPYKAQSIIDYWQRWHMSLTRFLMQRLYAPMAVLILRYRRDRGLAVDRRAQQRFGGFLAMLAAPMLLTMALAGVWHGSGWTFLVFGLLHGMFLSINHAWRLFRPGRRAQHLHAVLGRVALTYLCVLVGAVVFRAPSLEAAAALLAGMLGQHGLWPTIGDSHAQLLALRDTVWLAALFGIVWLAPNTQHIMAEGMVGRFVWRPTWSWAVAFGGAAALGLLSIGGTGEFVYFQF